MTQSHDSPNEITRALVRPTWIEVDLDAIEHNVRTVKKWLGDVKLIGVLKGDACGFGVAECGVAMEAAGVDMLAVGNPFEVRVLRRRGVRCPILLFVSYTPDSASEIATLGAIPTIVDRESAEALAGASRRHLSKPLEVFVKVDTGLGRLGVPLEQAVDLVKFVSENPYLQLTGIYSHTGGSTDERAEEQLRRFQDVLSKLDAIGISIPTKVIASTPRVLKHPHMWMNAVDPGRLLFGIKMPPDAPVPEGEIRLALRGLRTRLIQVKNVSAGDPPRYGYGRTGKSPRYGVLPFGWTDVLLPSLYEKSGALVRGVRVRFLSGLSMEHSVIDLTDVPDAKVGDVVTLIGRDGDAFIDVSQLAKEGGVLINELTGRFDRHLSCMYFKGGKPVKVSTRAHAIGASDVARLDPSL